jgi:hypothetical protein
MQEAVWCHQFLAHGKFGANLTALVKTIPSRRPAGGRDPAR